jgi:hypothetical protein
MSESYSSEISCQPTTRKHGGSNEGGNSDNRSGLHSCKMNESGRMVTKTSGMKWKGEKGVSSQLEFKRVLYFPFTFTL